MLVFERNLKPPDSAAALTIGYSNSCGPFETNRFFMEKLGRSTESGDGFELR